MACVHIYFGLQGAGKTFAFVYKMNQIANDKSNLMNCYNRIAKFNTLGYRFSYPQIPIMCDFNCELHRMFERPISPYRVNGYFLGLPVEVIEKDKKLKTEKIVYRTMLLPPGMRIFLDEGHKYFNSHDDDIMPDFRLRWIELLRQWGQELYLCVQRPFLVSKSVRDYADFTMFLKTDFIYDMYGNIAVAKLQYRYFQNYLEMEAFVKNGILPKGNEVQEMIIDCTLPCNNIPKYYDTEYFAKYFLKGAKDKDFDLPEHQQIFSNPEDIDLFCKNYNYKVPKQIYSFK